MAMTSSGQGGIASDINVTPLIDVLLVLLIIFMVIVPVVPKGLGALVPQPTKSDMVERPSAIVVSVLQTAGMPSTYKINQESVAKGALLARLTAIYANRADRVMFVKGDDNVEFSQVAELIDIGHAAGVSNVGLMTPKIMAGQ